MKFSFIFILLLIAFIYFKNTTCIKPSQKTERSLRSLPPELHSGLRILCGFPAFIKKSVLDQATTAAKLAKIDIKDDKNRIDAKKMELVFAVKAEIDKVQKETAVSSLQIYSFQMECRTLLEKLTAKLLERCPLKYPIVRHLVALDPRNIAESPENACEKMNYLLKKLM